MLAYITEVLQTAGYVGIFALMLAENVFPPIPSEVIMSLAGFISAEGELSLVLVILAGTLGAVVGALFWYYLGYFFGKERLKKLAARYGRVLTVTPLEIEKASNWFEHKGKVAVLIGRCIPLFRTLISVPAGVVKMKMGEFLILTLIGSTIWTTAITVAGYILKSNFQQVEEFLSPVVPVIIVGLVAYYFYRVITFDSSDNC